MNWETHPAAELFPMMEGEAFDGLLADIEANGLREPLVLTPDGRLLDGRNRLKACRKLGLKPEITDTKTYGGDPWRYVVSANLHRRHLTPSQCAMVASRLATLPAHRPSDGSAQICALPPTQGEAADLLGVSRRTVQKARRVQEDGADGLAELVDGGTLTVHYADRIAGMSPSNQKAILDEIHAGAKPSDLLDNHTPILPVDVTPASEKLTTRHKNRRDFITEHALTSLLGTLDALGMVLERARGLDPAITDQEAADFDRGLRRGERNLRQLRNLINDRKDARS